MRSAWVLGSSAAGQRAAQGGGAPWRERRHPPAGGRGDAAPAGQPQGLCSDVPPAAWSPLPCMPALLGCPPLLHVDAGDGVWLQASGRASCSQVKALPSHSCSHALAIAEHGLIYGAAQDHQCNTAQGGCTARLRRRNLKMRSLPQRARARAQRRRARGPRSRL